MIKRSDPPSRVSGGGSLLDRYVSADDRMQMARHPLSWYQITTENGNATFCKADASAIVQANTKRSPRDFRIVSRKTENRTGMCLWIQFNPGYWEAVTTRRGTK